MRILILGFGNMGRNHERILRALGHDVLTVDPDRQTGAALRSRPENESVDALCIATPAETLAEVLRQGKPMGVPTLIEKPMASSLEEAEAIDRRADEIGPWVRVGFTECFNPAVAALAENLTLAGELRHIDIQRLGPRPPATPVLSPAKDLATHDIALLRRLGFKPELEYASQDDGHLIATLRLTDRLTATIKASHLHPMKIRTFTAVGDDGMLALDYQAQSVIFHYPGGSMPRPVQNQEPLRVQWQRFFERDGIATDEAVAIMRLAEEMERGAQT